MLLSHMKYPTLEDAVTASFAEVAVVAAPPVDAVTAKSSFVHLGKTLFAAVEDDVDTKVPDLIAVIVGMTVVANAAVAIACKVSPSAAPGVFLPHSRPHTVCRKYYQPVAKFLVPDWGDKVDFGINWPARLHGLAGRYDNPMPESNIFPSQGLGFGL